VNPRGIGGLAALPLLLLLVACQGPAPAPPGAAPDLAVQAAEALDKGDYQRAADLYGRALEAAPESLPLHYGLGVAASHLGNKDVAVREFRWVLARGIAGSPEVEAARRWLVSVGALPRPAVAAKPADEGPGFSHGSVEGRAVFAEGGEEPKPAQRMMVILVGQPNSPTKEERYNLRTDENGRFKFPKVVPGPYMLTDRVAGPPKWRMRIEIQPGQEMVLDLTSANSTKVRDDFPERG
jgi:hypothetical protein